MPSSASSSRRRHPSDPPSPDTFEVIHKNASTVLSHMLEKELEAGNQSRKQKPSSGVEGNLKAKSPRSQSNSRSNERNLGQNGRENHRSRGDGEAQMRKSTRSRSRSRSIRDDEDLLVTSPRGRDQREASRRSGSKSHVSRDSEYHGGKSSGSRSKSRSRRSSRSQSEGRSKSYREDDDASSTTSSGKHTKSKHRGTDQQPADSFSQSTIETEESMLRGSKTLRSRSHQDAAEEEKKYDDGLPPSEKPQAISKVANLVEGQEAMWIEEEDLVSAFSSAVDSQNPPKPQPASAPQLVPKKRRFPFLPKKSSLASIPEPVPLSNPVLEPKKKKKVKKIKRSVVLVSSSENASNSLIEANAQQEAAINMAKARQLLNQALTVDGTPRLQDSEKLAKFAFQHAAAARRIMTSIDEEPDLDSYLTDMKEKGEQAALEHQRIVFSMSLPDTPESVPTWRLPSTRDLVKATEEYALRARHYLESILPTNIDPNLSESMSGDLWSDGDVSTLSFNKTYTFDHTLQVMQPPTGSKSTDAISISSLNEILDGEGEESEDEDQFIVLGKQDKYNTSPRKAIPIIDVPVKVRKQKRGGFFSFGVVSTAQEKPASEQNKSTVEHAVDVVNEDDESLHQSKSSGSVKRTSPDSRKGEETIISNAGENKRDERSQCSRSIQGNEGTEAENIDVQGTWESASTKTPQENQNPNNRSATSGKESALDQKQRKIWGFFRSAKRHGVLVKKLGDGNSSTNSNKVVQPLVGTEDEEESSCNASEETDASDGNHPLQEKKHLKGGTSAVKNPGGLESKTKTYSDGKVTHSSSHDIEHTELLYRRPTIEMLPTIPSKSLDSESDIGTNKDRYRSLSEGDSRDAEKEVDIEGEGHSETDSTPRNLSSKKALPQSAVRRVRSTNQSDLYEPPVVEFAAISIDGEEKVKTSVVNRDALRTLVTSHSTPAAAATTPRGGRMFDLVRSPSDSLAPAVGPSNSFMEMLEERKEILERNPSKSMTRRRSEEESRNNRSSETKLLKPRKINGIFGALRVNHHNKKKKSESCAPKRAKNIDKAINDGNLKALEANLNSEDAPVIRAKPADVPISTVLIQKPTGIEDPKTLPPEGKPLLRNSSQEKALSMLRSASFGNAELSRSVRNQGTGISIRDAHARESPILARRAMRIDRNSNLQRSTGQDAPGKDAPGRSLRVSSDKRDPPPKEDDQRARNLAPTPRRSEGSKLHQKDFHEDPPRNRFDQRVITERLYGDATQNRETPKTMRSHPGDPRVLESCKKDRISEAILPSPGSGRVHIITSKSEKHVSNNKTSTLRAPPSLEKDGSDSRTTTGFMSSLKNLWS